MALYTCVKRFPEISVSHRHWRAPTHCAYIHGYARTTEVTIGCDALDTHGWVFDLGALRPVRSFLEQAWDHRVLVADDDPLLADLQALEAKGGLRLHVMDTSRGWGPTLESSCQFVFDHTDSLVREASNGRARIIKIEIWEKGDNRAAKSFA